MSKSKYIIYQLNTDKSWQGIIDEFNKDKEDDKKFKVKSNETDLNFMNIEEYRLYARAAETKPDWIGPLNELVSDLGEVVNVNNSFVLFIKVGEESYVVTAGQGYMTIESHRNFNFGMDLLSHLIDIDEDVIKKITDRYLAGNIVGGNYQYHRNVSISGGKSFNNYFSELYAALPSETIEEKLGIKVNINKKDYRFLAKDSVKLSKALTLKELDALLGSISGLLQEESYSINPVSQIDKKNPVIKKLDKMIIEQLIKYIEDSDGDYGVNIVPFYQVMDYHYIKIGGNYPESYESKLDIIESLKNKISFLDFKFKLVTFTNWFFCEFTELYCMK